MKEITFNRFELEDLIVSVEIAISEEKNTEFTFDLTHFVQPSLFESRDDFKKAKKANIRECSRVRQATRNIENLEFLRSKLKKELGD